VIRLILQRLLLLPVIILLANLFGFWFGVHFGPLQAAFNPYSFSGGKPQPLVPAYLAYLSDALRGNLGVLFNGEPLVAAVFRALTASAGLLIIALTLSTVIGVLLGLRAVRTEPPHIAGWMTVLTTIGLASPSFFVGILFVAFSVIFVIWGPTDKPLFPFQGFGWDTHLVLPTLALMVLPTVKIAQVTSGMMVGEMGKQYVVAARSFGHSPRGIRFRHAFRNVIVPVTITISGSLRLLVAELIIIERIFGWPGLGRLLSTALISGDSGNYLNPPLLGALLAVIAAIFLVADLLATWLARRFDPRVGAAPCGLLKKTPHHAVNGRSCFSCWSG
jgi:peptide/nickel transport system permease protein